jgi:hypothetical protein
MLVFLQGPPAMTKTRSTPWQRSNPKPKAARKMLTPAQKACARKRAAAAGRRYPNLIDNMVVARGS